jgi:hypothetical protein
LRWQNRQRQQREKVMEMAMGMVKKLLKVKLKD